MLQLSSSTEKNFNFHEIFFEVFFYDFCFFKI